MRPTASPTSTDPGRTGREPPARRAAARPSAWHRGREGTPTLPRGRRRPTAPLSAPRRRRGPSGPPGLPRDREPPSPAAAEAPATRRRRLAPPCRRARPNAGSRGRRGPTAAAREPTPPEPGSRSRSPPPHPRHRRVPRPRSGPPPPRRAARCHHPAPEGSYAWRGWRRSVSGGQPPPRWDGASGPEPRPTSRGAIVAPAAGWRRQDRARPPLRWPGCRAACRPGGARHPDRRAEERTGAATAERAGW